MDFILKILLCLAIAAAIGFLTGLFWSRRRRQETWAVDKEKLETKVRGFERDLDKARGEAKTSREQLNPLKSELAAVEGRLKSRDAEFGALQERIKLLEPLESELAAKKSELSSLTIEIGSWQSKLAAAEAAVAAAAKKPVEPDKNLLVELNTLKQNLTNKDGEIATLLARVKELAPLGLQIKDRDIRLRDWESKYSEALKGKDEEIAKCGARVRDLEAAAAQANSLAASVEAKLKDLEANHQSATAALAGKDDEILMLRARVSDLEPLSARFSERESELQARISELEAANAQTGASETRLREIEAALAGKDDEILMLRARVSDLEPLSARFSARESELQARISELESANAQTGESEARLREIEAALAGKDEEIQMLSARVGDLEPLRAQLHDYTSKLREAESRLSRIHDLEVMFTRAVNPPPQEEWDDLVAINGVGPVLTDMLHRLGIYTFKQVALWNDEQIEWVDAQLEHFHGRIRRENWVESARDEHFKKYSERI